MHGGTLWVEPQPGQGANLAFTLLVVVAQPDLARRTNYLNHHNF
jgi:hypothetical protein